jgi:hypothetical protein
MKSYVLRYQENQEVVILRYEIHYTYLLLHTMNKSKEQAKHKLTKEQTKLTIYIVILHDFMILLL